MKASIKSLCLVLCVALIEVPFAVHANAGMIPTGDVTSALMRGDNREKVARYMQRREVRNGLTKFGVNPDEAAMRVASLSDSEIQRIAGEIDRTPAGADVIVISLTTVLLIVIILLLIGKI